MDIKRTQAAAFIDEILMTISDYKESGDVDGFILENLMKVVSGHGLQLPVKCTGEAHSNALIDNCRKCMPHWGWVVDPTRVK